jgi:hypothetical protein
MRPIGASELSSAIECRSLPPTPSLHQSASEFVCSVRFFKGFFYSVSICLRHIRMLRAPILRAFSRLQSLRPGSRAYHASAAVQGLPDDLVPFCRPNVALSYVSRVRNRSACGIQLWVSPRPRCYRMQRCGTRRRYSPQMCSRRQANSASARSIAGILFELLHTRRLPSVTYCIAQSMEALIWAGWALPSFSKRFPLPAHPPPRTSEIFQFSAIDAAISFAVA